MAHPRKPPRLAELFVESPVFFVTFNTLDRQPVLANEPAHRAFRDYASRATEHGIAVGRYVLMPDHVHLFVCGGLTFNLGLWERGLKRAMTLATGDQVRWQPGFFDHVLRNDESYGEKWLYVRDNPVRAGLVARWDVWPYQGEITHIDRA